MVIEGLLHTIRIVWILAILKQRVCSVQVGLLPEDGAATWALSECLECAWTDYRLLGLSALTTASLAYLQLLHPFQYFLR